ncbi:MAG: DUF5320 domain-containing protein [Candidatus Bathyarchaeia archaeon]|nr:DUF5320 domain-containing protein [Candidatus Bathyarchaeia archaeon]
MRGWRYRPRGWWYGWWCPRHPWPPAWARVYYYPQPYYPYPADPNEEIKALEDLKSSMEMELADITKRIEELKKLIQEKK